MDCKTIFENLAGDFKATLNKIGLEDLKNAVPDISADTLKSLIQSIKERAEHLNAEDINNLWETAKELCRNNPIQATILVLQVLILACPLLLTAPFLALLGFTGVGPLAGSIAASLQSAYGVNAIFSTLQSAAMGGYGASIVAGGVRAASFAGTAINLAKGFWYNSTETAPTPKS
ncbi:hypothetical protein BDV97DRAFT_394746 [Delphinella strobiligena]|nr:hypothetical protein BDV97DRAFT_394746 [Delphinella strobiligena]